MHVLMSFISCSGIGGSYLGANFVYESLLHDHESHTASKGRQLRFLANVDPVAFSRAVEGLKPENTMAIVISKTFTTKGHTRTSCKSRIIPVHVRACCP